MPVIFESPNEATNATKRKLAAAHKKQGPCPPAPCPPWLACPLDDYVRPCRIDESGGWNGSPGCLPIRVSGIFSRELCCIDQPSAVALGPMSAVYRPFKRRRNRDGDEGQGGARATQIPSNGQGPAPHPAHLHHLQPTAARLSQPAQSIAAKIESPHTGLPTKSSASCLCPPALLHPTRLASHSTLSANPSNATTA